MATLAPAFLDPAPGSTVPRPPCLRAGSYPLQGTADILRFWQVASLGREILEPFGESVGDYFQGTWYSRGYPVLAIDCRGDPNQPEDHAVVQIGSYPSLAPPDIFLPRFAFDWRHSTLGIQAAFNRTLLSRSANSYLGQVVRDQERPAIAATSLSSNGGTTLANLTQITLVEPGNATKAGLDAPLVAEDGSGPDPVPLRIPAWVGRWGFRGAAGQVLAGGATNLSLGFSIKIKPLTLPFTEQAATQSVAFASATAEYGCESYALIGYTQVFLESPATYYDPDFTAPGPVYPCRVYGQYCWKTIEQTATAEVYLTPLGDSWQVVLAIQQIRMLRSASGGRYVWYSNFVATMGTERGSVDVQALPPDVTATPVACGATTTITRPLFSGEASLAVTLVVSATGQVTTAEARIQRNVPVSNLGPGWHDSFRKLA
jgi:hypothetical protein